MARASDATSISGPAAAVAKMRADGQPPIAVAAFEARLRTLLAGEDGQFPGDALAPLDDVPSLDTLDPSDATVAAAVAETVVVKVNGGLGTSMGLRAPKSAIEVKPGVRFLDVIARQVLAVRERHAVRAPLVLMNSFATREASLRVLAAHPRLADQDVPLDVVQSRQPKLWADTLGPAVWPADPELEWCPPGHGDLYAVLPGSGMLARLRTAGYRWAFVSNADNLGATVDGRIPAWAATAGAPFVMEVVRGTAADRKGGHLARRQGRIVLRETAQVPPGDPSFGDVDRWRFYNTNNVWIDLEALERVLAARPQGPDLPLIVNRKTVDPTDPSSPAVLQLETALGAAIGAIDGATAVLVPRARFAPVKTTDDLLVMRSDAYELHDDGALRPAFAEDPPVVALDPTHARRLDQLDARFPCGPPSLRDCTRLIVRGAVTFGRDVAIRGTVEIDGPRRIPDGAVLEA